MLSSAKSLGAAIGSTVIKWAFRIVARVLRSRLWRSFASHWLAYFTFRWFGWPKFHVSNYFRIKDDVYSVIGLPGILAFVSTDRQILNWRLNRLLTGCQWGHAGLVYIDNEGEICTMEMINSGFLDQSLLDLLREVDDFALIYLPMTDKGEEEAWKRVRRLKSLPRLAYDFTLRIQPDLLRWVEKGGFPGHVSTKAYCSGLVYLIAHDLVLDPDFRTHWFGDREIFEPDDVYAGGRVLFEERNP